ncbi:MAG: flagellar hook-length control protein FliK [Rhodospirillales bacterium]|nr:flagellar hook-length control protein FliK [Rhodospirillales bacterium]
MSSSAITNSIMPTVSIPGATSSESAGSGFGDVMASITDNWSERKSQIKYDAANSAHRERDDTRTDLNENRRSEKNADHDHSSTNDRRDDEPRRADNDRHDDHAKVDDPKSHDKRDAEAAHHDDAGSDHDMEHSDSDDGTPNDHAASEGNSENLAQSDDGNTGASETENTTVDTTQVALGIIDPNQPAQSTPLPGSPEAIALANAKSAQSQTSASGTAGTGQNAATGNGQTTPSMTANAAAADGTTDGLMSSTALSQPAAGASAKMAMNGTDDAVTDELSPDKFLSRVMDSMSGDGKAKSDATGISNAPVNSQSGAQQNSATNPAQTAQAAQQAMAAAAGAQNMQNNPAVQNNVGANGAVTATGGTEATAQAANGQLNTTTSTLQQTNTGGQTAQTARQAPTQQVQQQVAVSIKNAANDGVDKISVQLRPEHLGRVDVKMEIGHDGRIQGVIQADTRETLDLLRQDSRALQQALKDAGLNADSQSFTFEHRDQGGQSQEGKGQSQMTGNQGSSPDEGDILSGAELAEHVGIGYGINPNGLVDIRI